MASVFQAAGPSAATVLLVYSARALKIEMARAGGVPRDAQQAQQLVKARMNSADGTAAAPAAQAG